MKRCLIIFFCCFFSVASFAEKHAAYDSSRVEMRSFSPSSINTYKADRTFQYDRYVEPPKSLWDRFWDWVWRKLDDITSTPGGEHLIKAMLILFGVAAIVFLVWKISGAGKTGLFARGAKDALSYQIGEEDIHSIPFDEAISKAMNEGNYRLVVRLCYLQNLKILADKELIDHRTNKTNYMYLQEMRQHPLHTEFAKLTYAFEHAWYGNNEVTKDRALALQQEFEQFQNQL